MESCLRLRRETRGVGGRSPLSFFTKLKDIALILEKNTPIMFIYGLDLSFKMQFYEYQEKQSPIFFTCLVFLL